MAADMRNAEVVDVLQQIGDLMELRGDEAFRTRAYREAARQLDLVTEDIDTLAAEGRLTDVKGVGPSIARTIQEYLESGHAKQLDRLREQVPESLAELLGLRHFGSSRIVKVHEALGVSNLDELEAAARDGRLERLPGFGKKSTETLLASIAGFRVRRRTMPRYLAESTARTAVHSLRQMANLEQVELAGAIRRLADLVEDVVILAADGDAEAVIESFFRLPLLRDGERLSHGQARAFTREKHAVRLYVVSPAVWGQALAVATGSAAHVEQLAARARGLSIGFAGGTTSQVPNPESSGGGAGPEAPDLALFLGTDGKPIAAPDEAAFYQRLGLPWIPPELREGRGEIEAAVAGTLPHLIETKDVRGDLHVHTRWSDGRQTVEQMARRAHELGLHYLGIADHSQSLGVARGLSLERLAEQRREIARVDAEIEGLCVLAGVELDIRSDGTLDYPDEVLAQFDFVTASIHSGFQQSPERLTERVIQAMRSPHVDAIGHLTGRVLGWRDALEMDVEAILRVAAETGTAMEINAWPNRLDIHDAHARRAKELGVKLVINTDSHADDQLEYMHYGVEIARRAWLEPHDVLNTLPLEELRTYLRSRPHKAP
jgi:DNA polymerase (family 10)